MIFKGFVIVTSWAMMLPVDVYFPPVYFRVLFRLVREWVRQYEKRLK